MGMDLKSAIDERRIHHQLNPAYIQLEEGFPHVNKKLFLLFINLLRNQFDLKAIAEGLKRIGHDTSCYSFGDSGVQGVQRVENRLFAYSDPRKGKVHESIIITYLNELIFFGSKGGSVQGA